jgi:hypothetical protein
MSFSGSEDAVGEHDDVARLLLAVHDDPPEAVVLKRDAVRRYGELDERRTAAALHLTG